MSYHSPKKPLRTEDEINVALMRCTGSGTKEDMRTLLIAGADPNKKVEDTDAYTGWGYPIFKAVGMDDFEATEILIAHGARLDTTLLGDTPLHTCLPDGDMVDLLVKHGAPVNQKNSKGDTPLHRFARAGELHVCQLLHKAGADPTLTNNEGKKPSDLATHEIREYLKGAEKTIIKARVAKILHAQKTGESLEM